MRKCFQSLGLATALLAAGVTASLASAQQAPTGKKQIAPPPPVILIPPTPKDRREYRGPPVIVPAPPPGPRAGVITSPSWDRRPMPEFPETAIANNVRTGRVVLMCAALPDGALSACEVAEETPPGQGFAASALRAAQGGRLSSRTVDGAPADARIRFTINYAAPE